MTESFEARLESEKLAAMKELAYGASHEINNPLANIAARAQTLLRDEQHPERRRALESIHQQAMRAHEMISDLMLFARPPQLQVEQVDLVALLTQLVEAFSPLCERRNIQLTLQTPPRAVAISADAQQLRVAVTAVCTNAMEAIGENGAIKVELREDQDSSNVTIEVSDTGPGISDEVRSHLFDPFYSGRESGRGLGFGLSKTWRIVTEHGGTITVSSEPAAGTTFAFHLPSGVE